LKTAGLKAAAPAAGAVGPVAEARAGVVPEAAAPEEEALREAGAQGEAVQEAAVAQAGAAEAERRLVMAAPMEGPASAASTGPDDFLPIHASTREAPLG
jgi:hypothetical protein